MSSGLLVCAALMLVFAASIAWAELIKPFPKHWGETPAIQTQDYVELPGGYGQGSSTLAHWITENLAKDADSTGGPEAALYENNFESVAEGKVPEDFLVLNGGFAVKTVDGNKLLELPGTPLESFGLQFGPAQVEGLRVSARISGTSTGRRYPVFGIGLNGVGGYKLRINPARRALELFRGDESSGVMVASTPFKWTSGSWTHFVLQVRKVAEGEWRVEGKAWIAGATTPTDWLVSYDERKKPINGRPSLLGSPYSGTPILYDDLVVTQAVASEGTGDTD